MEVSATNIEILLCCWQEGEKHPIQQVIKGKSLVLIRGRGGKTIVQEGKHIGNEGVTL